MVVAVIGLGILTGMIAGAAALIFGYSFLTALGIYALSGSVIAATSIVLVCAVRTAHRFWMRRRHAYPG
ncbi:hypothetical protein [Ruegeria arenilitoris]|uniref:hypothetical protein n=1 Tax=Ruegeria arenilitoris TaxID=1173585 RepID=UPI003C7C41B7